MRSIPDLVLSFSRKWGELAKFPLPFEILVVVPRTAADKECYGRQR